MRSAAVVLLASCAVAAASPQVEIKAQAQLVVSRVRLAGGDGVEISGKLVDKLTGDGLEGQRVVVGLGAVHETATTGPDGSFRAIVRGEPGPQEVAVTYRGAPQIDPAKVELTTDPAKAQVELAIAKDSDDKAGAKLRVIATSDDGPVRLDVELGVAPAHGGEFRALRRAPTNQPFVVSRSDAGGPGSYRLRATFPGDDLRQPASAEALVELAAGTTTTLALGSIQLAFEDALVAIGKVVDDDGKPVPRAAVTLTAGDRRLAQSATGDDGAYRFKVEAELVGEKCTRWPCDLGLQVSADPGSPALRPSRSPPAVVRVAARQPVPVSYTVAAFVATALVALGFFAGRSKPWRKLRRPAPPAEVPSAEGEVPPIAGGLVVAKPGIVSTLRGRSDDSFSGVVRDTVRGRPVAQAVVRLVLGDVEKEVRTAADGSFSVEKLAFGEWRAEVAAHAHVTERFGVTIPHRGELRGVRVDLVPVRERVFQLYRRAAEPNLPEPRLWGVWSPRQVVDHVRGKRPSPALAELTDFVEEIYFSARPAGETVLPAAGELVDRAVQERARR